MTDLFNQQPTTKAGDGNGKFQGYAANGTSRAEVWAKIKSGELTDLHKPSLAAWWKLAGRTD